VIFDPTSSVLLSVNVPPIEPTLVLLQPMTASAFIVALPPAAERLAPTVASDVVPLPVLSFPSLPGPAAKAVAGARVAIATITAAASHPARRRLPPRRFDRADVCVFMMIPQAGMDETVDPRIYGPPMKWPDHSVARQ
jgi:hypothetical protein